MTWSGEQFRKSIDFQRVHNSAREVVIRPVKRTWIYRDREEMLYGLYADGELVSCMAARDLRELKREGSRMARLNGVRLGWDRTPAAEAPR